ncbi:FGGY-family carbohydrate kinase [Tritonibacter horizontis]|uniref:L-fuculokinase n=1 Tax=Tritonibacter horizontis TaxID=1768241 RepID=A0A132BTV4_9RHOB|nr:FGGY-family carbohydrate kinase [Tritonibacter horizontis]KUP91825.1 L-fuculokinase [Tritonibacter horizontis]
MPHVAVLDLGKTNAKLALVATDTMQEIAVLTRPNTVLPGPPYPHFDTEGLWAFFLDSLRKVHREYGIDSISVTTHGACFVLLSDTGALACPVLDYEHDGPDALAAAYDKIRPAFAATGAPRLPMGLNVGAQLHWLLHTQPDLRERVSQVVSYPQYWSGRLTGHYATEPTSLGCHTDLWVPQDHRFSDLPAQLGLRMAPLAAASDIAGVITREVVAATGLAPDTPVHSGIHDSNASLLPHLRLRQGAFSVVSTGTWVVTMAVGGAPASLDPERDTLINVNALGQPTPSARFMGGREYEQLRSEIAAPTPADIARVLDDRVFLWPATARGSGPFPERVGGWSRPDLTPQQKGVALPWYLALMTAECLSLIGAAGCTTVEGPFARNPLYLSMLGAATGRPVRTSSTATGTSIGAALLADSTAEPPDSAPFVPEDTQGLEAYAAEWRAGVGP